MSRVVTKTGSVTLYPSSYDSDHSYYALSSASNAYTAADSTTRATINLTRGSSAITYIYFKFDTSSIPLNATITSIACQAKVYVSNANNTNLPTRAVQMFSGTTAKGSASTVSNTTTTFTLNVGSWTREELEDTRIRLYAKRGTNSTTSNNYYFYFYGATLEISYTYEETLYTVSASSTAPEMSVSPASAEYEAGESGSVTISGTFTGINVLDNNTDVTAQLVFEDPDYTYTISNIQADHIIVVSKQAPAGPSIYMKINGVWTKADGMYVKRQGSWEKVNAVHIKDNGVWNN